MLSVFALISDGLNAAEKKTRLCNSTINNGTDALYHKFVPFFVFRSHSYSGIYMKKLAKKKKRNQNSNI